jgi:DNA polymerase I
MKKLYLVDVSSMVFRAFYAIRPLSNPAGMQVNAIYGFLSMTVKLLREIRPDYMAFCFDRKEPSFRVQIDPNYKANRAEMPEDLAPQIPYIRTLSEALGIPCFDRESFEADDIIGTLTKFGRDNGLEVVIVSGDKDFAQLIRPFVSMYDTMKEIRYDESAAIEKWGVEPRKMIDYLAIVGDSSDNVPGVAGLGPKGAQKLLAEYDSLEEIYGHLDAIQSASVKKKLEESRENAFLSKKLVTIVCDMPLNPAVEDLRLKPIVRDDLQALLTDLDFKSFARTLLGESASTSATRTADMAAVTTSNAEAATSVDHVHGSVSHVLNPSGQEIGTIAGPAGPANRFIRKAPVVPVEAPVVAPVVAPGLEVTRAQVGSIEERRLDLGELNKWLKPEAEVWALHTERGTYIAQASAGDPGAGYTIAEVAANEVEFGEMLSSKNLRYKGFDLKDFCKRHHVTRPKVDWDQMLAAYVIRAGHIESPHPLFALYNGEPLPDLPSPSQLLTAHIRLETQLRRKLESIKGERILFDIEQPLVPILLAMETAGIRIDLPLLRSQSESLARDVAVLEKEIHKEAGVPFNIGSPKQLGQILFEKLKMPTGRRTKTGYSTDNEVLEKLSAEYPITSKVLHWRELTKLKSTYVDALPQLAHPETGRVHTTFNQALTATGRLSSTNPNLQNIPIRTERGNQIRKAFIAAPGCALVSADYSQLELRILAHITGDPGLVRAFESNADIHAATASEIFEVKISEVTPEMRRKAKAVNFGLAYGQSAFGLAETLRISRPEATEIITRYFSRFSGVKTYMTDTVEEAKKTGYVETTFGRRRYLDELFSKSPAVRKFGERAAINAPIQGAASDLVKLAMIKVGDPENARMLLQVHDELVLEVKEDRAEQVAKDVAEKMEQAASLRVPLRVNTGFGPNWDEAHS